MLHRGGDLGALGVAGNSAFRRFAEASMPAIVLSQASFAALASTAFSYWMIMSFSCSRSSLIIVRSCAISAMAANSVRAKDALTERE